MLLYLLLPVAAGPGLAGADRLPAAAKEGCAGVPGRQRSQAAALRPSHHCPWDPQPTRLHGLPGGALSPYWTCKLPSHRTQPKSAKIQFVLFAAQIIARRCCLGGSKIGHLLQVGPVEVLLGNANGSAFATPLTAPGQVPWVKHPQTPAWMGAVVGPVRDLTSMNPALQWHRQMPAINIVMTRHAATCSVRAGHRIASPRT